jgi:hypothetical protein
VANVPNDSLCDDNDVCTGAETCDAGLGCQAGAPLDPDDGVSCTVDSCDPVTGVANVPTDSLCDDNDVCTGTETCDEVLDCQAGMPLVVDDGVACTDDSCDPVTGVANVPNDSLCDDNDVCTGAETCDAGLGCQAGAPLDPDDGVACTDDSCDPITGIANVPNDGLCADADLCNGTETCSATLDCQAGTPLDPDDGVGCTVDSCDPVTGIANVPNDAVCDNGLFCDGAETCDAVLDCQAGMAVDCSGQADACNYGVCNETTDACEAAPEPDDTPCDNGDACPGDLCQSGICVPTACEIPFTVLANGVYDNQNGKDFFVGGPDGSEPLDDLRTPAEERIVEILADDPSFYWEARYEDLAGGTVSGVEVLVHLRRDQGATGDVHIEVWSGGGMLAAESVPMESIVNKGSDSKLPPTEVLVPVPIDGSAASVVNDMTVLLYISQPNNGRKVWWSYTEVRGTGL